MMEMLSRRGNYVHIIPLVQAQYPKGVLEGVLIDELIGAEGNDYRVPNPPLRRRRRSYFPQQNANPYTHIMNGWLVVCLPRDTHPGQIMHTGHTEYEGNLYTYKVYISDDPEESYQVRETCVGKINTFKYKEDNNEI